MQAPYVAYVSSMPGHPSAAPTSPATDMALQYLRQLAGVIVRQKVKWLEEMTGFEQTNK